MPGFDQTGPVGRGPMTGWKMGRCTNYGARRKEEVVEGSQTTEEPLSKKFRGRGFGRGRRGCSFGESPSAFKK